MRATYIDKALVNLRASFAESAVYNMSEGDIEITIKFKDWRDAEYARLGFISNAVEHHITYGKPHLTMYGFYIKFTYND